MLSGKDPAIPTRLRRFVRRANSVRLGVLRCQTVRFGVLGCHNRASRNRAFTCDSGATDVPVLQRTSAGCLSIPSVAACCEYLFRLLADAKAVLRRIGSTLQQVTLYADPKFKHVPPVSVTFTTWSEPQLVGCSLRWYQGPAQFAGQCRQAYPRSRWFASHAHDHHMAMCHSAFVACMHACIVISLAWPYSSLFSLHCAWPCFNALL